MEKEIKNQQKEKKDSLQKNAFGPERDSLNNFGSGYGDRAEIEENNEDFLIKHPSESRRITKFEVGGEHDHWPDF